MVRNIGVAEFHLKKGRDFEAKEIFKEISAAARKHFGGRLGAIDILDIGCASGELPVYLKRDLGTKGRVAAFDLSDELVENARERFAGEAVEFSVDNVAEFSHGQYDLITMISVLSYFDDPYPVLDNALRHLKPGGMCAISGLFNEHGIEVRMRYRRPDHDRWMEHAVLHQFSLANITSYFSRHGLKCEVTKQIMPFDIPRPKDNPARSWTVNLDGERYMMSGLNLVYNINVLYVT